MHPLADQIIYSKRRTLALEITPEARLIVRSPKKADMSFIYTFIEAKKPWILKKKYMMARRMEEDPAIELVARPEIDKEKAAAVIKERLDHYSSQMGLSYDSFRLSGAKKRWGVCSRRANIRINWRLAYAQETILDYVVVHELSHIKEKNHSKRFWALVAQTLPDHKARRRWLKDHGHRLHACSD
jgi:predicted metal-dependent hydrolase